jgi:HD-like signal output (HDOD) protein
MQQAQVDDLLTSLEKRVQDGILTLPVLPHVSSQVMQLVNDPDSDAATLTGIIQSDQSMAGHVMRISFSGNRSGYKS